jgi:hypothetical protein
MEVAPFLRMQVLRAASAARGDPCRANVDRHVSADATKPWQAMGIGRATYYSRRKPAKPNG